MLTSGSASTPNGQIAFYNTLTTSVDQSHGPFKDSNNDNAVDADSDHSDSRCEQALKLARQQVFSLNA